MRMRTRIERIEKEVFPAQVRPLVVIPVDYGQDREEARAAYCQANNVEPSGCEWIFVQRFHGAPVAEIPRKPEPMDRQAEIASILSDLQAEGLSEEDIAEMLSGKVSKRHPSNEQYQAPKPPKRNLGVVSTPCKNDVLEVNPASFEVAALSRRHR